MTALNDADQDAGLRDYVDRLRSWGENDPDPNYFTGDVLNCLLLDCGHASVAFATFRARATAAEAELAGAWAIVGSRARENQQLEARATAAEDKLKDREAEIERLREALEFYADPFDWHGSPWPLTFESPGRDGPGWSIARAALASTEHPASSEEATDERGS